MNKDQFTLHHPCCHRFKTLADALKTIGSEATFRFSRRSIDCIHSNQDNNVCIIAHVRTSEMQIYEYNSYEREILVGIRPSELSAKIGSKKKETLVLDYNEGRMRIGLYSTAQPNFGHLGYTQVGVSEGKDVQYTPAEYPDEPNLKVTGVVFRKVLGSIKKDATDVFVRPYEDGLQFLGRDIHGIMIYNEGIGKYEGGQPIFFSPQDGDEFYEDEVYNVDYQSIPHDPLLKFDHLQIRHKDLVPLYILLNLTPESGIIKIYYNEDRHLPIKYEGPFGTEGTWTAYIQGLAIEEEIADY